MDHMAKVPGPVMLWAGLGVLSYVYVVGELSHFLLGIVSRPMSQELHYGDLACLPNPDTLHQSSECRKMENETGCVQVGLEGNISTCVWDYSGLGLQYQILAGPAFVLIFTISGVLIGLIADRFNRKVIVAVCCGVLTAATGLTAAATSYWHLVAFRMTMGAGESAFTPVCSSMISDMFSESRRALALGVFNWGIYFGYGLSYAVGNFVTAADIAGMGWRWSYIVTGLMGVLATVLIIFVVREPTRTNAMDAKYLPDPVKECPGDDSDAESVGKVSSNGSVVVSPTGSDAKKGLMGTESSTRELFRALVQPPVLMLAFAACIRQTAGFSWAYNTQLYFLTYYPDTNLGLWITGASIIGGSLGVAVGGFVSDRLVKRLGLKARLYVLAVSQFLAAPFAAGVLLSPPPTSFFILLGAYLFAETWFGVMYAVLLELVPNTVQSTALAIFIFVMNNVGGNLPVVVDPLTHLTSYRIALLIMYPGGYLASSVFFFLTSFLV